MEEYPQIFYIDPPDDIEDVKEKVLSSKKRKIILVLPEENKNLKSIEKLTILQREAQIADKEISIYSTDNQYRKIAEDCGIPIEESLVGGSFLNKKGEVSFRPQVSDILPRKEIASIEKGEEKPEGKKIPYVVKSEDEGRKIENLPKKEDKIEESEKGISRKKIKYSTIFYLITLILLLAGAIFAYFWLPSADITLYPVTDEINFSGEFWVKKDTKLDLENSIVPGTIIEKERKIEKSFTATGEEERNEKAKGEIIVYNKTNSPYQFVPGTRFQSPDGKIFKALDWISIPAGTSINPSTVKVLVEAEAPGEDYNIKPTDFKIPALAGSYLYDLIYGKSEKSMSGGFIGKTKVIKEEDIEEAKREIKSLQEKAVSELTEEIFKDLPSSFNFLKEAIVQEKGEIVFDKKAGEIGETFKAQATVKIKLLTFKEEDVRKIISEIVKGEVKDGIEFQELLFTQVVNYQIVKAQGWTEALYIEFKGSEKVAWKIDEEEIKEKVMGKSEVEFQDFIKKEMEGKVKDSKLILSPFWVSKIPTRPERVKVKVQYE